MAEAQDQRSTDHGLIWITGYSASGKTTVGRIVERRLKERGLTTIFLDGDDLRSILGAKWGYDRDASVELAHVNFRLCSHLAAQGMVVVISAVAMYDEVRTWLKVNVPRSIEVYLDVPEDERRRRDLATKNVYSKMGNIAELYDRPTTPDLSLGNFGDASAEDIAGEIIDHFLSLEAATADVGRKVSLALILQIQRRPNSALTLRRERGSASRRAAPAHDRGRLRKWPRCRILRQPQA